MPNRKAAAHEVHAAKPLAKPETKSHPKPEAKLHARPDANAQLKAQLKRRPELERAAATDTTDSQATKGDPVRTRVLRGAAQVFADRGYGASSVEAILEAAQVSRRTFYRAFRSKEDVLQALFDNSVQMLVRAVRDTSDDRKTRVERAHAGVEAYIRVHAKAGPLARVLLLEQFAPGSPLAPQRDRAMATFIKLISRASARPGQPEPDPILVAAVVSGINQICVQMATEYPQGNWDVARAKRAILRILIVLDDSADPLRE